MLVGLTGGIGSGKTLVSDRFAALGVTVIDADVVAREVVATGSPGLEQLVSHYGESILTNDGRLNREKLRTIILEDPGEKAWLEQCLHPLIRIEMAKKIAESSGPYSLIVVPLLTENKSQYQFDRIVVVDCDESTQVSRASKRDETSSEKIRSMMSYQASRKERLAIANDVIDNNKGLDELYAQVDSLHRQYLGMAEST